MSLPITDLASRQGIIGGDLNTYGVKINNIQQELANGINELYDDILEINGVSSGLNTKLDKDGYVGTAQDLKDNIDLKADLVGGKVPLSQMDDSLIGAVEYKGTYDATTNTPTLTTTPSEKGVYYVVDVAGTQFGLNFGVGDWIISNGTIWQKLDNSVTKEEIGLGNVDNTSDLTKMTVSTFVDLNTSDKTIVGSINEHESDLIALDDRVDDLETKVTNLENETSNIDNTSDLDKPISTATQTALNNKLEKGNYTGTASDLNTAIQNIGDGSPKGVYATLTALQTAYPTGTTGIYVVTYNGNWYYWNGSAWTSGGVYQATAIANKSIKNYHLESKLLKYIPSKLQDFNWEMGGIYLGADQSSTIRIRTLNGEFVKLYAGDKIILGSAYKIQLSLFNDSNIYVSDTGFITNTYTVVTEGNYRLAIQKTSSNSFTPEEIESVVNSFKIQRYSFDTESFLFQESIQIKKHNKKIQNKFEINFSEINFEIGSILNGSDITNNRQIRVPLNDTFYLETDDIIFVGGGLSVVPYCYDVNNNWINLGIESFKTKEYKIVTSGYYRFAVKKGDGLAFNSYELNYLPDNFKIIKHKSKEKNNYEINTLVLQEKVKNADVISDMNLAKMSHASMLYADTYLDDGTIWGVYYTNEVNLVESPTDLNIYIKLVKFNISKPKDIISYDVIKVGVPVGGFTQIGRAPYDPNIIVKENELLITFNSYINSKVTIGTLVFNKNTEIFENYNSANLTYYINSTPYNVTLDTQGIRTAYEATTGLTLTSNITDICLTNNFCKYNNEIYGVICEVFSNTGFKGMLIKTTDGVNWELVSCPTGNLGSLVEASIAIKENTLFLATRGYTIGLIATYDLINNTWSDFSYLPDSNNLKCSLLLCNSKIYITYNKSETLTTDFGSTIRSALSFYEIDSMLNFKKLADLKSTFGIHYPCLFSYKGDLYCSYSEDRRKLSITWVRSNISFINLPFF